MEIKITCSELAYAINKHLAHKFQSKINRGVHVSAIEFEHEQQKVSIPEFATITLTPEKEVGQTGLYKGWET